MSRLFAADVDMYRLVEAVQGDVEKLFSKRVKLADDRIIDFGDMVDGLFRENLKMKFVMQS